MREDRLCVAGRFECGAEVVETHRPSLTESAFNSERSA